MYYNQFSCYSTSRVLLTICSVVTNYPQEHQQYFNNELCYFTGKKTGYHVA